MASILAYPTAAETVSESPWSDNAWADPGNIYSDDGNTASVTPANFDTGDQTFVLKGYTFDFSSIPSGATIDGVIVRINCWYANGTASLDLAQLLDVSRAKVGTNKASTPIVMSTDDTTIITLGASDDLWGNSLTESWVKDSDFGIALGCLATGNNADVFVDYVTIEVFYTESTTHNLTAQDIVTGSPTIQQATIGQTHVLTAQNIETGSPTVDQATIGQTHELTAQNIETGAPTIEQPTLEHVHALTSQNVETGNPTVDQATIGQTHELLSQNVETGSPTIEQATLTSAGAAAGISINPLVKQGGWNLKRPPDVPYRLNYDNPIVEDLELFIPYIKNRSLIDFVKGRIPVTDPPMTWDIDGHLGEVRRVFDQYAWDAYDILINPTADDYTVMYLGKSRIGDNSASLCLECTTGESTVEYLQSGYSRAAGYTIGDLWYTNGLSYGDSWGDICTLVNEPTNQPKWYQNARGPATIGNNKSWPVADPFDTLRVGYYGSGGAPNFNYSWVAIWKRALSETEIEMFTAQPWLLYQPVAPPKFWSIPGAPAAQPETKKNPLIKQGGWNLNRSIDVPYRVNRQSPLANGLKFWLDFNRPWSTTSSPGFMRPLVGETELSVHNTPIRDHDPGKGNTILIDDNSAEYIRGDTPASLQIGSEQRTLACWFWSDETPAGTDQTLISLAENSDTGAASMLYMFSNTLAFYERQSEFAFEQATYNMAGLYEGHWNLGVGVKVATNIKLLYFNGLEVGSTNQSRTPGTMPRMGIGGRWWATVDSYWSGWLWNPMIWNRALTAEEILSLYKDPWQLYQPTAPPIFWSIPGAPPSGHDLTAQNIETGYPTIDQATIGQTHILTAQNVETGNPTIEQAAIGQTHVLTAQNIETGSPTIDQPTLQEIHTLTAQNVETGNPTIDQATIGQTHVLTSQNVETGNPTVEQTTLGQTHILTSQNVETGAPTIGQPTLAEEHALTAQNVETGNPTVEQTTLGQTHILTAQNVETGAPTIEQATIGQTHVLTAQNVETGNPTIEQPTLSTGDALTAQDVVTGNPTIDQAILGQTHVLTSQNVETGNPTIEQPTLGTENALTAQDIVTGNPTISQPTLGQTHILLSQNVTTSNPTISQPTLGQTHILASVDTVTGSPVISQPSLQEIHALVSQNIETGNPVVEQPSISQTHILSTVGVVTDTPVIEMPGLGQVHILAGQNVVTGLPVIDTPLLLEELPETPPERVYIVEAENRVMRIEPEDRTVYVEYEDRTI